MNSGLLVVVSLFLIYLAVTGKYSCVTAAARCIFSGAKLCECGEQGKATTNKAGGQLPDLGPINAGRKAYDTIKGAIDAIRGAK